MIHNDQKFATTQERIGKFQSLLLQMRQTTKAACSSGVKEAKFASAKPNKPECFRPRVREIPPGDSQTTNGRLTAAFSGLEDGALEGFPQEHA
ncbi:MAG: hypothetical protein SFU83_20595 [Meiothermus sp.]|nr:hypothetical protein [Meiothermus sp.]